MRDSRKCYRQRARFPAKSTLNFPSRCRVKQRGTAKPFPRAACRAAFKNERVVKQKLKQARTGFLPPSGLQVVHIGKDFYATLSDTENANLKHPLVNQTALSFTKVGWAKTRGLLKTGDDASISRTGNRWVISAQPPKIFPIGKYCLHIARLQPIISRTGN